MKVSVVIPVFNEKKYLKICLINLENQIEKPDEIIVVDNNCTDKTIEIAKKFKVKIIKEKQQGISYARNRGFNTACGDIIVRCDADTIVPPDWIKKIKANFKKYKIDALTGPGAFYDSIAKTPLYSNIYFKFVRLLQKGKNTLNGFNMAITRAMWKKVKNKVCLDNENVHEDIDLAIHVIQEGGNVRVDKSLIVKTSARRLIYNPRSFFGAYPMRFIKTLRRHQYLTEFSPSWTTQQIKQYLVKLRKS